MSKRDEYSFYMRRCVQQSDGSYVVGDVVSIEDAFVGLRYKSLSGINNAGKPKGVYTEDYAEVDGERVYVSASVARESIEMTLTLYFLNDASYGEVSAESYGAADGVYHAFLEYITGCEIFYWDTARQRKVLMHLEEAIEPSTDSINGASYLEAQFKFSNAYGVSFAMDDTTIEKKLGLA